MSTLIRQPIVLPSTFIWAPSFLSSSLQKIKHVYTSEFKPYVVFVKPPRIEELRLTRRRAKFICDDEDKSSVRIFSVGETVTCVKSGACSMSYNMQGGVGRFLRDKSYKAAWWVAFCSLNSIQVSAFCPKDEGSHLVRLCDGFKE